MQHISLPPGRTRVEAREESRRTVEGERADARRSQREMNQFGDVDHQLKKARVVGMQAQAEKIAIDTIQTKIQLLRENADVYRSIHGEQRYNEMIVALINKMTRTGGEENATYETRPDSDLYTPSQQSQSGSE
jgi:hypothetical protein